MAVVGTFAEFFAAAEKLKAAGVTPLAVGDFGTGIWATAQLFENTLLGAPAGFRRAFNDAVATFVVDKNADRLVKALAQAAREAEMAK